MKSGIETEGCRGSNIRATGGVATSVPFPAVAQSVSARVGLVMVNTADGETGPLGEGGMQMDERTVTFVKEKNHRPGRNADLISANTKAALPAPTT